MLQNSLKIVKKEKKFLCFYNNQILAVFLLVVNNNNLSARYNTYLELSFYLENCGLINAVINNKEFF